ncbi:MAG: MGMT family protein [Pirellulales bacterium]|nr:MGMT family protein [Pirellulales bacterium]
MCPTDASRWMVEAFETELGWMALGLRGPLLGQLTFAHKTRAAALNTLRSTRKRGRESLFHDSMEVASQPVTVNKDSRPLFLVEGLTAYARGEPVDFTDVSVWLDNPTPFRRAVLKACRRIPYGQTVTYGELASLIGRPGAARAVGNCMATNRIPLIIPCHRVVGSSGNLGGFSAPGGVQLKRRLLRLEAGSVGEGSVL